MKETDYLSIQEAILSLSSEVLYIEDDKIEEMMEVNATAIMKMCKKIIPSMKAKKKGKLIFISSMAARRPLPNLSVYNASKAAIEAYAKSLYLELSYYGIDVYLIEPGYYPTNLWDDVKENTDEYSKILKDVKKMAGEIFQIRKNNLEKNME